MPLENINPEKSKSDEFNFVDDDNFEYLPEINVVT